MEKLNLLAVATSEIPDWFAVVMGVGTVFVGLISIIIICAVMGAIFGKSKKAQTPAVKEDTQEIANRQEIIAAVTAVCAEEMGKDIKSLRVVSFKKI